MNRIEKLENETANDFINRGLKELQNVEYNLALTYLKAIWHGNQKLIEVCEKKINNKIVQK